MMAIPTKRVAPPRTYFLERDEVETMFARMATTGPLTRRDRALLLFLYNTGARVQEVANLRLGNLELDRRRVHLHGKGDKWRACPLWEQTVVLLRELLGALPRPGDDQPVFVSQRGQALTRFGIYKIVRRHAQGLAVQGPAAQRPSISPHLVRHYIDCLTMSGTTERTPILDCDCRTDGVRLDPSTRHSPRGTYRLLRKPSSRSPGW